MRWRIITATGLLLSSSQAVAADKGVCGPRLVCASKPETVVAALQAAGYRAKASVDAQGDPKIESAASGYDFVVYFYGCEKSVRCDSLQFNVSWASEPSHTAALANEWNREKRFVQASVGKTGRFIASYDVTTVGGINATNFADTIDWWTSMLGELRVFWKDNPSPEPATPANTT